MKPEDALSYSQESDIEPSPEPVESTPSLTVSLRLTLSSCGDEEVHKRRVLQWTMAALAVPFMQ
jgi:hypothetical protein